MEKVSFIFLVLFIFSTCNPAQEGDKAISPPVYQDDNCPKVEITNPPTEFKAGQTATYKVDLIGKVDKKKVGFIWETESTTTGKATINKEPISSTFKIATEKESSLSQTKIQLEIVGLNPICNSIYVAEIGKTLALPKSILFDEIVKLEEKAVERKLTLFFEKLDTKETSTGYIVNYGTPLQIKKREELIKKLTAKNRYCHYSCRLVLVNGGKEMEIRTRLWIVPQGADPSTID